MTISRRKALTVFALAAAASVPLFMSAPGPSGQEPMQPAAIPLPVPEPVVAGYIEVMEGCDFAYAGTCVTGRTAPRDDAPIALQLRAGMVLAVATSTITDEAGGIWYEAHFNEWIRYPGRIAKTLYVRAEGVRPFVAPPSEEYEESVTATTTKRIVVDRSEQKLYAYDGDQLIFWYPVSTGLAATPTPRGEFIVFRKTPSRYMQGPLPGVSSQYYDLPGVPWDLYFTKEGGTIHGAYWHASFGKAWSHGCVNLAVDAARAVYNFAPVGTPVLVRD